MKSYPKLLTCLSAAALIFYSSISLADDGSTVSSVCNDAVIKAKIVTAYTLNSEINPFKIDVTVDGNTVTLDGTVSDETEHNLAKVIAENTSGVKNVKDNITVDTHTQRNRETDFAQKVQDATTTATIKSKLLMNKNTSGLTINVTTINNVVTLKGEVDSKAEKELAEQIAKGTQDVKSVRNYLSIKK